MNENVAEFQELASEQWKVMVRKFMIEEARVASMITLTVTDNWIEFTARYVVDYRQRRKTKDAIMRALLKSFEDSEGKIEFGSATFEVVAMPQPTARA